MGGRRRRRRRRRTDDNTASRSRGLSHNFYLRKSQLRLSVKPCVVQPCFPPSPPSLRRRATRFSERFGFLFPSLPPFEHRGGSLEEAVSAAASDKKEEKRRRTYLESRRRRRRRRPFGSSSSPAALLVNYTRTHEIRTRKHPGEVLIFFMSIVRSTSRLVLRPEKRENAALLHHETREHVYFD